MVAIVRSRQVSMTVGGALAAAALCMVPEAGGALAETRASEAGIEEVIVTAQRREESLQETPIAVTALTGADLNERMAASLVEVGNFVPNLDFSSGTQSSRSSFVSAVYIRGIGQTDFIVTTDPGVGIYVDGVYYGRMTGGVVDMLDIERVEVLRGPQGTLFGKNTIGGAVSVVSAPVSGEFGGSAEVTAGRFDRVNFRGDLNVPLTANLFGRIAVLTKRSDGFGRRLDFATGEETMEQGVDHSTSARARLRWLPSENVEAHFSFDYTRVREPQVPNDLRAVNPAAPLLGLWNALVGGPGGLPFTSAFLTEDDFTTYATGPSVAELDLWGPSLNVEWRLGELTLRSITAYRKMDAMFAADGDGSPLRLLGSDRVDLDQDQISQEFHLLGSALGDRVHWLTGLYVFRENAYEETNGYVMPGMYQALAAVPFLLGPAGPIGPCPPPAVTPTLPTPGPLGCAGNPNNIPLDLDFFGTNDVEITNYALFGHATLALGERWSVTGGARYTYEEKIHDQFYQRIASSFIIAPPGTRREDSWSVVTPKVGLEFKPSEDLMTYLSVSRGFRSGGFNGRPFFREAVDAFDPEYVWSYEIGVKSEWLDRHLIANAAVFFNDYSDIQLTSNRATADGNVAVITENAGEAEIKGFELEVHARPVERLDLIAGLGYIDAKFTEIAPRATVTEDSIFVKTPEWDLNFGAQYTVPMVGLGSLSIRADYSYRSEYYNDVANNPGLFQDGFGLVNARIAFEDTSGRWQVALFGTNLGDEHYITGGVGGAAAIGFDEVQYGRPREWGVTVRYSF